MTVAALDSNQIGKVAIGAIVALVVIGALLSLVITAIFGRIILLVLVIVGGVWVWQQRTSIENHINRHDCKLDTTFFGVHVKAPPDVATACQHLTTKK